MKTNFSKNTDLILVKIIVVAVIILVLLWPIHMVKSLIKERQGNKDAEQTDIGWKHGGKQLITGPVLVVPYIYTKDNISEKRLAYFLPDEYLVNGNVKPEERTRGIQKILNYQADMKINGRFSFPEVNNIGIDPATVSWGECFLMTGIPHLQNIRNKITFKVNDQSSEVINSIPQNDLLARGIMVMLPLLNPEKKDKIEYSLELTLNGTEGLYLNPVGKYTSIHLTSDWKSVEYTGDFLATEKTDTTNGIDAQWDIFDYNRDYTQSWKGKNENFEKSVVGIDLELPLNHYDKTLRAVKYAIMFIVLTFLVFFLVELVSKKRIHPVQYLLVSLALILFYTLLLAFSEHIGFTLAYIISSIATISLITAYSHSIFKEIKQTVFMGIFLIVLYLYLYIVLQLENMALLFGATGLFIALAIVMYVLRKVEWYKKDNIKEDELVEETPPAYIPENDNN
ncbi:inner membrane protein [Dysgonomonas hofstadii]|uniref:Inner membrane protein n=1 Tax=Dysgonomonas hofstadii TaxID=637886 RepID=A0A840CN66_9BACT|nr:cell envelope integrity protein CreD [Dysgonomonas hofstadii]MBB4036129.1 inner membrane protein [Dysgonomonas hofstadii]